MAKTFSVQGGFLKYENTTSGLIKAYNLVDLVVRISGDTLLFPDGNAYAYNDPELTNSFASVEAFFDQVGLWKATSAASISSATSAGGINSDTSISGGNWVGDTYTGLGELNDYAYVGVNLQVDEAGTLYFDFSQDGTNWSTYPVGGFTIVSTINEVHTAWKGGRYMRPRFVGTGGRSYFRLKTFYSNTALPLSAPLNQGISSDQDAQVVRAVAIGEDPTGSYVNEKVAGSSYKTTASLNSGSTFDSGVIDITQYQQVQTQIVCDQNGTLRFVFGSESNMTGTTVGQNGVNRVITLPYEASKGFESFSAPAFTDFVRYEFTNDGGVATTHLLFQTKLLTSALSGQVLSTNAPIASGMVANLGRNILVGQNKAGNFVNCPVDSEGHLFANIHDPKTAFGQIATAEETTEIQVQFPLSINGRLFNTTTANGGTVTSADSMAVLQTSTNANGSAILETKRAMRYQPGQGGVVRFTGVFTTGAASSKQLIGYGDANDGFFFGYNGATFGIFRRQNGAETFIAQTAWNQDVADGSNNTNNPAGMNLDPTTGNVFQIEFQWLGFGAVIFSMEDPLTGDYEPVHIIQYAGANTVPSIYNPTLPLRWEVLNSGNTSNLTLKSASGFAGIQGKRKISGPTFSHKKTNSTTTPHVFSIRNKATNVYGGTNTNRVRLYLKIFSISNDGTAASTVYTIEQNATLSAGAWVDVDTNDSVVEYNDTATIDVAGQELLPFVVAKNQGETENIFDQLIELNPGETFTIRSSNNNDSTISLSWVEDI